jgi:hypothetical protein
MHGQRNIKILSATLQALLQIPALQKRLTFVFISYAENCGFRLASSGVKYEQISAKIGLMIQKLKSAATNPEPYTGVLSSTYERNVG